MREPSLNRTAAAWRDEGRGSKCGAQAERDADLGRGERSIYNWLLGPTHHTRFADQAAALFRPRREVARRDPAAGRLGGAADDIEAARAMLRLYPAEEMAAESLEMDGRTSKYE